MLQEKDDGLKNNHQLNQFKAELIINGINCEIFSNIFDSLYWLTNGMEPMVGGELKNELSDRKRINVLITGSLYLVGLSLKVLEQKIN